MQRNDMKINALITVLDSLNQTTMPYNEFILYRSKHYPEEQQIVLLTGNEITIPTSEIPKDLIIYKAGKNPIKIRRALKRIKNYCAQNNLKWVLHLHSIRGSFSTLLALPGVMGYNSTIYTIHSTFTGYRLHNKILSFIDALFSNYVTCVSNTSYEKFPNIVKRIKSERICALQNGVNIERVENDIKGVYAEKTNNSVCFVYIARMVALKNHLFLVDVLSRLHTHGVNNIKFIFIGEEEDDGKTRAYVNQKGLDNYIHFTGLIPRNEVYKTLISSDVYISSSTLEGLPVSVLEGMFCGLPAILSDIPQHREVANGCDNVAIVPFDIEAWGEKIVEFASLTKEKRKEMGEVCKDYVRDNFSLESMHKKYDTIYKLLRSYNN